MLYRKNFTAEKDILTKRYVGVCTVNKERYVTIKSISTKNDAIAKIMKIMEDRGNEIFDK